MSDPKLQAELAERVLARRRFLPFVKRMNQKYDAGWVHEDICERLERFSQAVVEKKSPRLMLLLPPRHGKSELASRMFPAWHLGRNSDHEFIACSYNLDLARTFSRRVQQVIDSTKYQSVFPAIKLADDNRSIENWALSNNEGAYVAAGIGGPITGKGAHVVCIDDPCLAEGSLVYTKRGLVPIELVVTGDFVLTHRGRWRKVLNVFDQGFKETIELGTDDGSKIRLTPEHLVYTSAGWLPACEATDVYMPSVTEFCDTVRFVPHTVSQTGSMRVAHVYDIEVEEDHSFVAEGFVVHNCKNAEEADSPDVREKIYQWYLSTAYSRLSPGGGLLLIQTWWHDADLAGRLMTAMREAEDEFVDQFEVVKYPAIAEADEWKDRITHEIVRVPDSDPNPLSGFVPALNRARVAGMDTSKLNFLRAKGEALHPARYDIDKLLRIKANNRGGRFWAALYQQNPMPDEGEYFTKSMFRRAATPPKQRCNVYIAWDFAISEATQNDWTVGTVGLQDTADMLHIADMLRFRSNDTLFIVESVIGLLIRWNSPNLKLGFEDGQIWRAISTILYKRLREKGLYPAITILSPIRDKLARARPLQGRMQQGMISFSDTGEWYDVARSEFLRFPAGANDDTVDSAGWVAQMCLNTEPPANAREKKVESWRDRLPSDRVQGLTHMSA